MQFVFIRKDFIKCSSFCTFDFIYAAAFFHCIIGSAQVQFCNFRRLKRKIPPLQSFFRFSDTNTAPAGSAHILHMVFQAFPRIQKRCYTAFVYITFFTHGRASRLQSYGYYNNCQACLRDFNTKSSCAGWERGRFRGRFFDARRSDTPCVFRSRTRDTVLRNHT